MESLKAESSSLKMQKPKQKTSYTESRKKVRFYEKFNLFIVRSFVALALYIRESISR